VPGSHPSKNYPLLRPCCAITTNEEKAVSLDAVVFDIGGVLEHTLFGE
jgi:hypothetical protein